MKNYILEYKCKKDTEVFRITMIKVSKSYAIQRFNTYKDGLGKDIDYLRLYECIKEKK